MVGPWSEVCSGGVDVGDVRGGVGCEFGGGKRLEVVVGHRTGGAPGYRG